MSILRQWFTDLLGLAVCGWVGHAPELVGRHYVRPVWVYRCTRCDTTWEDE